MVSIIVPTYNEEKNVKNLLVLIDHAFSRTNNYEVVFVDDHSNDETVSILNDLSSKYPIRVFTKEGEKGKAYSLLEGFQKAKGEVLAMIDADLQYPPEMIPKMVSALGASADIIVANRKKYKTSTFRRFLSRGFKFAFGKVLFGIDCDVQSGLKVFKKEVIETVQFQPNSPWSFDLEFIRRAKEAGYSIKNTDITFYPRAAGKSKIGVVKTGVELAANSLILKTKKIPPQHIAPDNQDSMKGAGVGFRRKKYITHTTLSHNASALRGFLLWQKLAIAATIGLLGVSFYLWPLNTAIYLIGALSVIYFSDVIFNLFLILKSLHNPPEISISKSELANIDNQDLPVYSILCPLYKESSVLENFVKAVSKIDWPKDKLDVLLLLEADDEGTIKEANRLNLPSYIRKIIVPDSFPKTKPKACNFGLAHAKGEFLVIYDAEDVPDANQLKKAYLAFSKVDKKVVCLQAKLNYHNPHQNLLTRFFTAEYSLWFDVTLTGLQSIGTTIPLGGTSNHFRLKDLYNLEGWDPFNVTEDADLGIRLFKQGFKTAVIDSTTLEEANSKLGNWIRQRSRWIKGYMQTYLVHMRNPFTLVKSQRHHAFIFQLLMGGRIAFMFINPFLWLATISYFAFYRFVGPTIESLYPTSIFYMAVTSLVFGNFLFMYYYMIGCAKKEQWSLIKYVFLVPFYWLAISFAATIALYQLIVKPHYWEKTNHGLNFKKVKKVEYTQVEEVEVEAARPNATLERIKSLISSGTASGGAVVAASVIANFLNFVYNAYLGRRISIEDFGLISLIGSFFYLSSIPTGALGKTITHRSAFLLGKYNAPVKAFWSSVRFRSIILGLFVSAVWIASSPLLSRIFKTDSIEPFLLFAPLWVVGFVSAVDSGFLTGNLKFKVIALIFVLEAIVKLSLTWLLVEAGMSSLVYGAIPASVVISFLVGWFYAAGIKDIKLDAPKKALKEFPAKFFFNSVLSKVSTVAFLSFDVILAKLFLSPVQAGEYALLSLVGKMIYFVGVLFSQFILPVVSRDEGAQKKSKRVFYELLFLSALSSSLVYAAVGLYGYLTVPLLFGDKALPIVEFLPIYGFSLLCFTIANSFIYFYQARKKYLMVHFSFLLTALQVIGIYFYHANTKEIVTVMSTVGISSLGLTLTLHLLSKPANIAISNIKDFLGLFNGETSQESAQDKAINVLIFNWRDTKHIWAGGAELYVHEIAKELIKTGNQVTVFCGNDGKNLRNEKVDGIQIIRRGGFYTVYAWAFLYYILKFRGKFDVILDSQNGIPFFTPLYTKLPVIGILHHIHQDVFAAHLMFPFNLLAKFLEATIMPLIYRHKKMITVSNSSKEEMEKLGLGHVVPIAVVHPGVDSKLFKPGQKTKEPSVLYLGRLKPYKSIETAIYALVELVKRVPNVKLTIGGEGESRPILEKLVDKLGLTEFVSFVGKVTDLEKSRLFAQSWVMIQPSTMEGWGITAIEANASGTPVVASNVAGLRESVQNPHTGYLVPVGDHNKFAEKLELIIKDDKFRKFLEEESLKWAQNFQWQKSAESILKIIYTEMARSRKFSYSTENLSYKKTN